MTWRLDDLPPELNNQLLSPLFKTLWNMDPTFLAIPSYTDSSQQIFLFFFLIADISHMPVRVKFTLLTSSGMTFLYSVTCVEMLVVL